MTRLDVPEIADQDWCPRWLRRAMVGYLSVMHERTKPYQTAADSIVEILAETGASRIMDLGSGAGGPWPGLRRIIAAKGFEPEVICSDIQPDPDAIGRFRDLEGFEYLEDQVSALDVAEECDGLRTMFTLLHHFDPGEVEAILRRVQEAGAPFAAFEVTHRSLRGLLTTLLIPLLVLVFMPFVRPFRVLPIVLTYFPPLLPVLIGWDGLASTLRTYRTRELRQITDRIERADYAWRVQEIKVPGAPIPMTQVIGMPRLAREATTKGRVTRCSDSEASVPLGRGRA